MNAVGNCARHAQAHAQVLERYDIGNITSAAAGWWHNECTFALLLEDATSGEPLGGVRLQRWGNGIPLPIEAALSKVDFRVHAWVASFAGCGVGELCGLWCLPRVKGFGLGTTLTRMGIALAARADVGTIFGLCDTRNVATNLGLGFVRDAWLATRGSFQYPKPGLFAHVLRVSDPLRLGAASADNRAAIGVYREAPTGVEVLEGPAGRLELERSLAIAPPPARVRPRRRMPPTAPLSPQPLLLLPERE